MSDGPMTSQGQLARLNYEFGRSLVDTDTGQKMVREGVGFAANHAARSAGIETYGAAGHAAKAAYDNSSTVREIAGGVGSAVVGIGVGTVAAMAALVLAPVAIVAALLDD